MRLENISKTYKSLDGSTVKVFENFSLDMPEGGVYCITGPSGCGKTTLLNIIAGVVEPDCGQVVFEDGEKGPVSYLFQEPRLLPWRTVLENCKLVCDDEERARGFLELAGLGDKAGRFPFELSGGERQRAAFARAFCHKSNVILMDEPFQNLDDDLKRNLASVFFRMLAKDRRTVVWVSHDLELAQICAKRIINISRITSR